LDKKTAEALKRRKSVRQSSAAEEAPVPIVTYVEEEMAAFKENITSPTTKKSTAIIQHSF